jgi:hypothetical protein
VTAIGAGAHLFAESTTNPPVFLRSKPISNEVTIRVLQNNAAQTAYTPELAYSLNLCLELM